MNGFVFSCNKITTLKFVKFLIKADWCSAFITETLEYSLAGSVCRVVRTEDMSQPGPSLITVMAPLGASTSQTPADTCSMLMSLHCLWATCLLCLSIINIDNTQANPIITDDDFLRYKRTNIQHIFTYFHVYYVVFVTWYKYTYFCYFPILAPGPFSWNN